MERISELGLWPVDEFYNYTDDYDTEIDLSSIPMLESEESIFGTGIDVLDYFKEFAKENQNINEETYQERAEKATLKVEVLDVNKFIKRNPSTKEIKNPTFFSANGG